MSGGGWVAQAPPMGIPLGAHFFPYPWVGSSRSQVGVEVACHYEMVPVGYLGNAGVERPQELVDLIFVAVVPWGVTA